MSEKLSKQLCMIVESLDANNRMRGIAIARIAKMIAACGQGDEMTCCEKLSERMNRDGGHSTVYVPEVAALEQQLAAKDAEIARLRSAANVEVGWLVEDEYGRLCIGLECGNKISWVTFTNPNAIRFARKRDAENAITLWKLNGNAREHSWA